MPNQPKKKKITRVKLRDPNAPPKPKWQRCDWACRFGSFAARCSKTKGHETKDPWHTGKGFVQFPDQIIEWHHSHVTHHAFQDTEDHDYAWDLAWKPDEENGSE